MKSSAQSPQLVHSPFSTDSFCWACQDVPHLVWGPWREVFFSLPQRAAAVSLCLLGSSQGRGLERAAGRRQKTLGSCSTSVAWGGVPTMGSTILPELQKDPKPTSSGLGASRSMASASQECLPVKAHPTSSPLEHSEQR